MKNLILNLLFISILTTTALGQTEKGSNLLGGNINTSLVFQKGQNTSNLNLNFAYGRFIMKNFALGISAPLYFSKYNAKSSLALGISPFTRFYFLGSERGSLFTNLNGGIIYQDNKPSYSNSSVFGFTAGLGFGYVCFLNKSIGLETELRYDYNKYKDYSNYSAFSLNIGFQIYFNKNNK